MEPASNLLFVYGTLLDPQVQQLVFGQAIPGQPDRLPGYEKLERSVAGRYAQVCPVDAKDAFVEGRCLEVGPDGLARADAYETTLYYRIRVSLESGARAWVYLASPAKEPAP